MRSLVELRERLDRGVAIVGGAGELGEAVQIVAVGVEGVLRRTALGGHVVQEGIDPIVHVERLLPVAVCGAGPEDGRSVSVAGMLCVIGHHPPAGGP